MRAAAADGAELVALPEKWNLLAGGEELLAGAEPLDGPSLERRPRLGRGAGHPPARRQRLRAGPRGEGVQHLGADRPRRRGPRRLPQDPHVRRRRRRRRLPRVRARGAGRGDRHARRSATPTVGLSVCYDLRFPELYRILAVRGARLARRALGLHLGHRARPLGGAAAGAGDREPGLRPRPQPGRRGAAALHSYGHSAIVDPWGVVLATAPDEECFVAADLDFAAQDGCASRCPRSPTAVPAAYVWPQLTEAHA